MADGREDGRLAAAGVEAAEACGADAAEPFFRAVERLERLVDDETCALRRNDFGAIADFNRAKSVGLLELGRAVALARNLDRETFEARAKPALAGLREALARNLAAGETLLNAVRQVAAIIARAIEEHDSDGTYAPLRLRKGEAG